MRKVTLIRTLPVLLSLLLCGGVLMAQSARKSADTRASMLEAPQTDVAKQARAAKLQMAQEATLMQKDAIKALIVEMKANASNRSYDMDAAVRQLRKSPDVIYPFNHYDPTFPIVLLTGNKEIDDAALANAKRTWRAAQND